MNVDRRGFVGAVISSVVLPFTGNPFASKDGLTVQMERYEDCDGITTTTTTPHDGAMLEWAWNERLKQWVIVPLLFLFLITFNFDLQAETRLKIQSHQVWNVDKPIIVALSSGAIDDLGDGIDARDKEWLNKMIADGRVTQLKTGDNLRVVKVYERKLGLEFAECAVFRQGKEYKRVWVFSTLISQLCSKVR